MVERPLYLLIRYTSTTGFVAYAPGVSVFNVNLLEDCKIVRYYPNPVKDLTHQFIKFQRFYKAYLRKRLWCSKPKNLMYRQVYGVFPRQQNTSSAAHMKPMDE
jgi:hypothetical protein